MSPSLQSCTYTECIVSVEGGICMFVMWHVGSGVVDQGEQSYCQAAKYPIASVASVCVTS